MLQYYVDLLSFSTVDLKLTSSNPRWVGAWWAGFLFIGSLFFIVSLPFFGFPRVLLRELRQLARDDPARLDLIIEQNKKRQHTGDCSANDAGPSSAAYGKNLRGLRIVLIISSVIHGNLLLVVEIDFCWIVTININIIIKGKR